MSRLLQSVRFALRQLRKSYGFAGLAVFTLALGIGATTAIYSIVYAAILAPLPYPNPDQLVVVWAKTSRGRSGVSAGDFLDWKRQNTVFRDLNAWTGDSLNLSTANRPQQIIGQRVTPGFYQALGVRYFLGREFLPEEGQPGKDHEVILTHRLWERLGANRNIIGEQLRINGEPYTVVGVMVPGPTDRADAEMMVPLAFRPDQMNHDFRWLLVLGRLKPGVSIAAAQADMEVVARRIAQDNPTSNTGWGAGVEPLKNDFFSQDAQTTLWLLMGAVGFVLLIACVNVANLLLARSTSRQKEVAIRASLGATRGQLFAQFLAESLTLAILGGAIGIGMAEGLMKIVMVVLPPFSLPIEADVHLSLPVLLFTLAVAMFSGVLFGCVPAWQASQMDPNQALKEGSRTGASTARHGLRRALVVAEFALALTLLGGAGLAIHSFWNLTHVDLGFHPDHILTFEIPRNTDRFSGPEQMVAFYRQLQAKIESLQGVLRAEISTGLPLEGTGFGMQFNIAGKSTGEISSSPIAAFQMVTPDYFQTFGIPIIMGRNFTDHDDAGGARVAMVNEEFAKKYLSGSDPLTQRVLVQQLVPGITRLGPPVEWQIVGVFHSFRSNGLRAQDDPIICVPFWQVPWPGVQMAVKTAGDPLAMTKSISGAVSSMDPDLPIANVRTMDQVADDARAGDRFATILYGSFAALALLLAVIGIYGVIAFMVALRTHEIGVRMALGAGRTEVVRMILREGVTLSLVGFSIGVIGTSLVGRVMRSMLYGVGAFDAGAFIAVGIILLAAAIAASYIPARRAAKVDPMVALRYE